MVCVRRILAPPIFAASSFPSLAAAFSATRNASSQPPFPPRSAATMAAVEASSNGDLTGRAALSSGGGGSDEIDPDYPGTAVSRMRAAVSNAKAARLVGPWEEVRRAVLAAGGLRDLPHAEPGKGYTGHSFNDWNHCDLTAMRGAVATNTNNGQVVGIAAGNQLGAGIAIASDPALGPGGSWSTCLMGCGSEPPRDVAHLQFKSRIAFKLVWCPPAYDRFVLVDDAGKWLNTGKPDAGSRGIPSLKERKKNFDAVAGSKYASAASAVGSNQA